VVRSHGDGAPAGLGFGWSGFDGAAVGDALLIDHHDVLVEVDVDPAQPGGLTTALATQGDQPPHGEQPVLMHVVEEPGQLAGGPHGDAGAGFAAPPGVDPVVGPHLRLRATRGG
jgi:hypothetical protein